MKRTGSKEVAWDREEWKAGVEGGGRREIAKALTLVESRSAEDRRYALELLSVLWEGRKGWRSEKIGFTGAPGAGKSSLIGALGKAVAERGERLAVLCVDPSSPLSGGSILGDRLRMTMLSGYEHVFVRGIASGNHEGGLSRGVSDAIVVCEAAGFDKIFVESGGVGQSQTAIRYVVDFLLMVVSPGGGDDVQAMKRGLLELVDAVAVSKDDGVFRADVSRTVSDLRAMLGMGGRDIPVVGCSILEEGGLEEVEKVLEGVVGFDEEVMWDRMWFQVERDVRDFFWRELEGDEGFRRVREELRSRVREGNLYPGCAVEELCGWLKGRGRG